MLYTLDEDELKVYIYMSLKSTKFTFENLVLVKTTFTQNFVVDELLTSFPPAIASQTTMHAQHEQARKLVLVFVSDLQVGARGRVRVLSMRTSKIVANRT